MDLMGPLLEMDRGNKRVLIMADTWVEAFSIPNMETKMGAEVLTKEINCKFWTPQTFGPGVHVREQGHGRNGLGLMGG